MSDEQFIQLVKQYPVLYDMSSDDYRDYNIRNNAWEEIADQLHTTVEECKKRWGKLRNCFTNALKRRDKKSGQDSTNILPWRYQAQMDFLLPHVKGRTSITNLSTDLNDDLTQDFQFLEEPQSPCDNAISPTRGSSSVRRSVSERSLSPNSAFCTTIYREKSNNYIKEMVDVMKSSQQSQTQKRMTEMMDETDHFFLSMSKQLKKLPKIDQTNIKFEIHKLIHDAEVIMIKKSKEILRKNNTPTESHIYEIDTEAMNQIIKEEDPL